MDRVELTVDDLALLLNWRDEHKDLVRAMPNPRKAIEIMFKHNAYRIKGIRNGDSLKLYLSNGYDSIGHAEFKIGPLKMLTLVKNTMKLNDDDFQSVLTVYCSLMALMANGFVIDDVPGRETVEHAAHNKQKLSTRRAKKRVTYIIRKANNTIYALPKGSHASPKGIFAVRGHYRHYKNGRVIWIAEYKKGTGRAKRKTYRMGDATIKTNLQNRI